MSEFIIQDASSNHKYRTELPNIIYEIGLSPALIGIYSAIKRCAGDTGMCTKAEKTLAQELRISKKTLHKFISQLCETNQNLKKPLIFCEKRLSEHGDKDTNAITIVDLWPDNYAYFTQDSGGRVKFTPPRVKITQGVGQNLPKGRVKFTHKEEPTKEEPKEEAAIPPDSAAAFLEKVEEFLKEVTQKKIPVTKSTLRKLIKKFGLPLVGREMIAFSKEKHTGDKDKSAIFTTLCNEAHQHQQEKNKCK